VNTLIRDRFTGHFTDKDISQIEGFLDRDFSENGQVAIGSIFLFAAESKKPVQEVLAECEREWRRNWSFQHPEIRGDVFVPGNIGRRNRMSLESIYLSLGIKCPPGQQEKEEEIPNKAITVSTRNSVYRLGEAGQDGERTISRDKEQLDFTRCRIIYLQLGQSMELSCSDGPHPNWYTSGVISIE